MSQTNFLDSAIACAAEDTDICTDSQMTVLRSAGAFQSETNWTNSFGDNDGGGWNIANGGAGDNHLASTLQGAACCGNITPARATDTSVGGVRVVHVHDESNVTFANASLFCAGLQADLCDKGQYNVLRAQGAISVGVWASDHSDNDGGKSFSSVGLVNDNPNPTSTHGFACCATDRMDLSCSVPPVQGVCMISVDNTGGTFDVAAADCASKGARVCSIAQTAVLRDAGVVTSPASWTGSRSDSDGGNASVGVGAGADDPDSSSIYGWACCQ